MPERRRKAIVHAVLIIFFSVVFVREGFAQSDKELRDLRLIYDEEQLVETSTRHLKPISQVAENITIITAEEIEAMNAHTVAEVLRRVPGVFVNIANGDFGSVSLLSIQGAEDRHVLVLLDGIEWNFHAGGNAETNTIPVGIIERIEIIKGPASAAWGSALGGVINIITKQGSRRNGNGGSISVAYGERQTRDVRTELYGSKGSADYYVYTGHQASDGLRFSREFNSHSFYTKIGARISPYTRLGLSMGFGDPEGDIGDIAIGDIFQDYESRSLFGTASLDSMLNSGLHFNLSARQLKKNNRMTTTALGFGELGPAGSRYQDTDVQEKTSEISSKLVFERGPHTLVLGIDYVHADLEVAILNGSFLQSIGVEKEIESTVDTDNWAIYLNDSIVLDRWSFTSGIRFDYSDVTGSFISPSLGVSHGFTQNTILRASFARGFTLPPLLFTRSGDTFLHPNRNLDYEETLSIHCGIESTILGTAKVKASFFQHEGEETLEKVLLDTGHTSNSSIYINNGEISRKGVEIEAETLPFLNTSLKASFAYADFDPTSGDGFSSFYSVNVAVKYLSNKSFMAELFGHHVWWGEDSFYESSYDDFIWDLNIRKKILQKGRVSSEFFFTGHNLFNGSQYIIGGGLKNSKRWFEAGIKLCF